MQDIKTITTEDLVKDCLDSRRDIELCDLALLHGHTQYSGGSIADRKHKNEYFISVITAELERRGEKNG